MLTRDEAGSAAAEPTIEPSRTRRLIAPVAVGVGVVLGTLFVRTFNPNVSGVYPPCPSRALLGLDCPGCGGLRATYCLAHGDIAGALDNNLLFVILVPFLIAAWALWMYRAWTGRQPPDTRARQVIARVAPVVLISVVALYTIVRNFVPYLGSGVG